MKKITPRSLGSLKAKRSFPWRGQGLRSFPRVTRRSGAPKTNAMEVGQTKLWSCAKRKHAALAKKKGRQNLLFFLFLLSVLQLAVLGALWHGVAVETSSPADREGRGPCRSHPWRPCTADPAQSIEQSNGTCGHGSKPRSEHPNPTTKIDGKMGGAPIPKWYHWF